MYIRYEEREVYMYMICSTNNLVREFTTTFFSQYNGFYDHRISEYTRKYFKKEKHFLKARQRVA